MYKREYYKIKGHENLKRDIESMGIINVDNKALNNYKEDREFRRKLAKMVSEHEGIKDDLSQIKQMLAQILSKDNK